MITAILILAIACLLGLAFVGFELTRVTDLYETMYKMLITERDAAREESGKLKAALFPQLRQVDGTPKPAVAPLSREEKVSALASNRRIPTRLRVKMLSQLVNTIQTGRDRMAEALKQEKTNG